MGETTGHMRCDGCRRYDLPAYMEHGRIDGGKTFAFCRECWAAIREDARHRRVPVRHLLAKRYGKAR